MKKLIAGAVCVLALVGCDSTQAEPPEPLVSGIIKENFDPAVRPQDDLFRHVNGSWLARTEIPADKSSYGAFTKLDDDAEAELKAIVEESAAKKNKADGSDEQKIGDFYTAFMDEAKAEELGLKPLEAELARIDAVKDTAELPALLAHLGKIGARHPFSGYIAQDAKDSTQYTVYFFQSAQIGLPDRDYYLSQDEKFSKLRAAYRAHVEKMLGMIGDERAAANAEAILAMETQLAQKHWTRVESRDDDKTYNKYEVARLNELTPGFDFAAFAREAGVTTRAVIVMQPSAFTAMAEQLKGHSLDTIKAYLKFGLVSSFAPYLSKAYVNENFAFYSKALRGIPEDRPRWKRAVESTEGALGEVVGKIYVAKHFPPEAKARMEVLVKNLLKAYEASIKSLDWMSEDTKARALEKLSKFTAKIGYPRKWKDYSKLTVKGDDLVGNVMRSNEVEYERQAEKLGKPVDREEWMMTPQTVNAYYNASLNEIVFPAAILRPPFFNMAADDAVNYGGIGGVIGHEIGHGFDDQGSKYNGDGNLLSWWTDADRKAFEDRTQALIAQYDKFCPLPDQCVQGALTIGENIGDLGGLSIAYKAWQLAQGGEPAVEIDGLTGDQRFFMGWAQVWARKYRDEELLNRLKTDPHSPSEYRCNGIVSNVPEFYTAFGVKEGDKLYLAPESRVKIW
ncbi:M13 family metallopeptidase [Sorangium sp. So ce341]|uniref:M13 family metallopeptidase n=1 Tax=Sorangium sp. So ce341 TaxID=3133302 RepID=UPI003F5E7076